MSSTPCRPQNTVNPAGQVGGEPSVEGQQFTYAVRAQGRLQTPEEFGDIVVRESADGGVVRVKDVASVELGSQDYNIATRLNGKPAAVVGIYQLPGSNAVEAAKGVRKLMAELETKFPDRPGLRDHAGYDGGRAGRHRGDRRSRS